MSSRINRRQGLGLLAATSIAEPALGATTPSMPTLKGPYIDLTTGEGNMLAMARLPNSARTCGPRTHSIQWCGSAKVAGP